MKRYKIPILLKLIDVKPYDLLIIFNKYLFLVTEINPDHLVLYSLHDLSEEEMNIAVDTESINYF